MKTILSSVEAAERATYDYPALQQQYEDKCPADYPWMKKEECAKLGELWAWQAGSMTEGPEIAFDNEMDATRNRARADGRLTANESGYETYYKNHPAPSGKCQHS